MTGGRNVLEFKILPNRNLEITLAAKFDEDEIAELIKKPDMDVLYDLMEYEHGNGGPYVTDSTELYNDGQVNLTDAPMIVSGKEYPDSGHVGTWGSVWWFPNYCVESCTETLFKEGKVVFTFGYEIGKPVGCNDCRRNGDPDEQPTGNKGGTGWCTDEEGHCATCKRRSFTLEPYESEAEWRKIEERQFRVK